MKDLIKHIVFLSLVLLISFSSRGQGMIDVQVIKQDTFIAGEPVIIEFGLPSELGRKLHCHSALGSVVLSAYNNHSEQLQYKLPDFMARKAGNVSWYLTSDDIMDVGLEYNGGIYILPKDSVESMETYLGPPDILAGGEDYSMYVSVPTDPYDNPMLDSTLVNLEYYFKGEQVKQDLYIDHGFVFYRIFSPNKSGRLFAVSECLDTYSKEYDVNIQPALPIDFSIFAESDHQYADGNQILTFKTSILTDTFNNVICDGTMVEFYIKNKKGDILRTRGVSQEGVAIAEIIHPEYEEHWDVQAIVLGMAESNTIRVDFEQVVKSYDVEFLEKNRKLVLGPIQSYMNQRVPDGFKVELYLYKHGGLVKREIKEMRNGYATFTLDPNEIEKGIYDIHLKVAGIKNEFQQVELW